MLLLDVSPFSLGVECNGGRTAVMIPRNTCIPARKEHTFHLLAPGAENPSMHLTLPLDAAARAVAIKVCEGESPLSAENNAIGLLTLSGLPAEAAAAAPAEEGAEHKPLAVRVLFDLDADCVLTVKAEEVEHPTMSTGRVVIKNESGHLSRDAVFRMAADHEALWDNVIDAL